MVAININCLEGKKKEEIKKEERRKKKEEEKRVIEVSKSSIWKLKNTVLLI